LARPDPDPKLRRIQPETGNLRRDRHRLMAVERKNSHAELEARRGGGELCQRFEAGSGRLVVAPQRVVPESLTVDGQVARKSRLNAHADTQPSADRFGCVH
jgi:hypothetical protein